MKIQTMVLALLALAACNRTPPAAPPATAPKAAPVEDQGAPALETWLGRWNGPEGTWLELTPDGAGLRVEISNLDGPQTYAGAQAGDHIEFQRNGKTESIRPGNGQDTGMKWLAEKKNCLVIQAGEGYCRD